MFDLNISLPTARNAMRLIRDGGVTSAHEIAGISQGDLEMIQSDAPWGNMDQRRCRNVLDQLINGTLEVMGLPRLNVPAEMRAAAVAYFVHPANIMAACSWLEAGGVASEIAEGGVVENVTASQLYAMVIMLYNDVPAAQHTFKKRLTSAVEAAVLEGAETNA
jgi:hypothetical protein